MSSQELRKHLRRIYQELIRKIALIPDRYPSRNFQLSRDNLLAYLALKQQNTSALEQPLLEHGLSSIEQANQHILYSLGKQLENLGDPLPQPDQLTVITPFEAEAIEKKRKVTVLGKAKEKQHAAIMVTLDSKMIHQPELLEKLLTAGMNIARINCAHDNQHLWKELIHAIREAETRLQREGRHGDRRCRIFMDLAGPKIRIGKLERTKQPIKLSVHKDPYGKIIEKAAGYLDCKAEHTFAVRDGNGAETFVLGVGEEALIQALSVGDEVFFTDTRNRRRKLKVMEIISPSCVSVEVNSTSYIDDRTLLNFKTRSSQIKPLIPEPVEISVIRGDSLRLYLDQDKEGQADSKKGPPGVPVTLAEAFRNVRMNDPVYIDDGKIHGLVKRITKEFIEIQIEFPVVKPAKIKEGKGLNIPDSFLSLNVPALTGKDFFDLEFVAKHADIIGISFVHSPLDLIKLREGLERHSASHLPVVAKIETKDAIHHLGRIIMEGLKFRGFGLMIARGDLAVEVGAENLSFVQDEIVSICSAAHIPVIWATGVLEKLTKKGLPSRSEITDVAQAKRAACIMLNKGPYIVDSVTLLAKLLHTEKLNPPREVPGEKDLVSQYGIFPDGSYRVKMTID